MRIIPAHAGNTRKSSFGYRLYEDHPRSCGEYRRFQIRYRMLIGSSPLMRGIPTTKSLCNWNDRIIPAHAGNTGKKESLLKRKKDHPRSCGEYITSDAHNHVQKGSSPLMRGIPFCLMVLVFGARIIPAHAGNTLSAEY